MAWHDRIADDKGLEGETLEGRYHRRTGLLVVHARLWWPDGRLERTTRNEYESLTPLEAADVMCAEWHVLQHPQGALFT